MLAAGMYCALSPEQFDKLMEQVADTSSRVLRMQPVKPREWKDRIYDVYQLCNSSTCMDNTPQVYDAIQKRIEVFVTDTVTSLLSHHDFKLISKMEKEWASFGNAAVRLDHLFNSFNRTITQIQNVRVRADQEHYYKHLYEIGLSAVLVWRNMLSETGLTKKIIDVILVEIDKRRAGDTLADLSAIKRVLTAFHEMDAKSVWTQGPEVQGKGRSKRLVSANHMTYHEFFEDPFLMSTAKYYSNESMELISNSFRYYIRRTLQMMNAEVELMTPVVMDVTKRKLARVVQDCFVHAHEGAFRVHIPEMLKLGDKEDWSVLYKVTHFSPNGPWLEFDNEFQEYVTSVLMDKCTPLMKSGRPTEYINCLLEEARYYTDVGKTIFQSNGSLTAAISRALQTVINKSWGGGPSTPEMLAKYIDTMIRKSDASDDIAQDVTIEGCMTIFRHLDDKDVFMKFYSHHLAKRLIILSGTASNQELEEGVILRLKEACGHEYTNKLYRMITDKNLSKELANSFVSFLLALKQRPAVAPTVLVLQSSAWPLSTTSQPDVDLPQDLMLVMKHFRQFYDSKFSSRVLSWHHNLTTGDIKTNFLPRSYQITMPLYQIIIITLFNNIDSMTIDDISSRTKMSKELMSGHLKALVDYGLLLLDDGVKVADWKTVDTDTVLSLNLNFKHKRIRFKLMASNVREVKEETSKTRSSAMEDRRIWVQAAIVRVMKSRKELSHQNLTQEVIELCLVRFKPNVPLIKKSIECLLEKGFLERSPKSHDLYVYVA